MSTGIVMYLILICIIIITAIIYPKWTVMTPSVVCYCSVGYRSSNVAKTLFSKHKQSTGSSDEILDVYNLEGGLFQWANERRGIVNNSGDKVATVHPYSLFWGKLLNYDLRHE